MFLFLKLIRRPRSFDGEGVYVFQLLLERVMYQTVLRKNKHAMEVSELSTCQKIIQIACSVAKSLLHFR